MRLFRYSKYFFLYARLSNEDREMIHSQSLKEIL